MGNEESDRLEKEGAESEEHTPIDLEIQIGFDIQGEKLATINQATAHHSIRKTRKEEPRLEAEENLRITREAIEEVNGTRETNATIWKSLRKPILRPHVQQFLYRTIHKTYMIGDKWNNIPGCGETAICTTCGRTESMQHILLECNRTGREL